jgi:hypothetical protein
VVRHPSRRHRRQRPGIRQYHAPQGRHPQNPHAGQPRFLAQKTRDGRQPHLLIGVPTPYGLFTHARLANKDNNGADYEITVPLDRRLTLNVISRDLKLGDDRGAPLSNNGAHASFLQSSGDRTPKSFQYTVLGQLP